MNKKGFISMAVVYTFLILFLLLITSLLSMYSFRNDIIGGQEDSVKDELNEEYNL